MEDYTTTRDIIGNHLDEPETPQDDRLQEEEELSLPIKIVGWVLAIPIILLLFSIPALA